MLYGAIIGDIAGSVWEFDDSMRSKPEKLFSDGCQFTDDTVMTVAVADALMNDKPIAKTLRDWGNAYKFPMGGYGGRFAMWLKDYKMPAYNSFGNGSAMRVSAVGWLANSFESVFVLAEETAGVTHNHPEGIKGAKAIAGAIFLARKGYSKADIKKFIEGLGYKLDRTCDEIRKTYQFNETCQGTIPEAMTAFLESDSFEDCIKLGISLGGDSDTLCAIAGSVAEAFYGIPDNLINQCREMLPEKMLAIIDEFEEVCK